MRPTDGVAANVEQIWGSARPVKIPLQLWKSLYPYNAPSCLTIASTSEAR